MQKRWSVNSMMMAFIAFALVLVVWVLFAFKMGFGAPMHILGASGEDFFANFWGKPGSILSATGADRPGRNPIARRSRKLPFPTSSLAYFQFVFAAITPILLLGSVLGRINFKAWIPFVLIWSSVVYTVNAFLLWGGGYFAQHGALDFSGGYVIHLAAGVSGFVAAAVVGPRLRRDREVDAPNNLAMVAVGAGLLWLGWNGFNGGDPYNAREIASAAVLNTNLCTAVAFLVWVAWDYATGRKPSLIGSVNGMIVGLVGDHPGGRLRQRLGRDRDRRDRRDDRLHGAQLPEPGAALPQRRRHARRGLHPRLRRSRGRPAGRDFRQQGDQQRSHPQG